MGTFDHNPLMNSTRLREIQAPLKDRYRSDPSSAVITLQADGVMGEGVTCSVQTGQALARAGLHPATGGDGLSLCSGDMLLQALVACAGVTMNAVATALDIPIREAGVHAEGDLDFRGTMAVGDDAPVGFSAIRLRFKVATDAPRETIDRLLRLTERYCVVYQTLRNAPEIELAMETV